MKKFILVFTFLISLVWLSNSVSASTYTDKMYEKCKPEIANASKVIGKAVIAYNASVIVGGAAMTPIWAGIAISKLTYYASDCLSEVALQYAYKKYDDKDAMTFTKQDTYFTFLYLLRDIKLQEDMLALFMKNWKIINTNTYYDLIKKLRATRCVYIPDMMKKFWISKEDQDNYYNVASECSISAYRTPVWKDLKYSPMTQKEVEGILGRMGKNQYTTIWYFDSKFQVKKDLITWQNNYNTTLINYLKKIKK